MLRLRWTMLLSCFALMGILSGCGSDSSSNYFFNTFAPGPAGQYPVTGQLQGVIMDAVTNQPVVGALVDLGFGTATTNLDGQFTMTNVPAVQDALAPKDYSGSGYFGYYNATVNLTAVNSKIKADYLARKAANPNEPEPYYYPAFFYQPITVQFTSVNQPSTSAFGNMSGSSVVRENLTATHTLSIGKLSTTVNGVAYFNAGIQGKGLLPLPAGSTVKIFDTSASSNTGAGRSRRLIDTTTTDATGTFTFARVQSNTAVEFEAVTADGKYAGSRTGLATPNTDGGILSIDQIGGLVAARMGIAVSALDTQAPIIIGATPESGSDINPATAATITFTFSEPMAADAYADALTASPNGGLFDDIAVNYLGAKAGNIAHSLAWNASRTALFVTIPTLGASSRYTVDLTTAIGKLKDRDGNLLGDPNGLKTVNFTTYGGVTAAAPTVTIVNSATLDYNSNPQLDWLPSTGAKYYAVYRSLIQDWGTSTVAHPYVLLGTTYDSSFTDSYPADIASGANYPTSQNKKFVENGAVKLTYTYQVKAINSDNVEGPASTAVVAADGVGTNLVNSAAFIGDITDGNSTVTIYFTEPLNKQAAQTASNYALSGISPALTVTNAVYNGWDDVTSRSSVTLTLSGTLNPANITRTYISNGADGVLNSTALANDGALMPTNSGGLCISPVGTGDASGTTLSTVPSGDDVIFKPVDAPTAMASSIYAGADGTCNTTAAAGDTQVVNSGSKPAANGVGITAATYTNGAINSLATDFTLQSAPAGDDVVVRAIMVTITGLTDVAGNAIKTTTTNANTAGNRINTDATFILP